MAIGSYLIHSGLPWTSPQKIMISSALYINNIVINRGLLNLLNNDYYLDLKTEALNNYILQNLGKHLSNTELHVSWSRINSLFTNIKIAQKDAVYYIPITWEGKVQLFSNIQAMLDLIPSNLNSHSIVLYLCHGYTKNKPNISNFEADLDYSCILINGFNSGDLVIYGENKAVQMTGYLTLSLLLVVLNDAQKIFDNIQSQLNNYNIISNNKFVIKSKGLNRNYATVAIKNSTANIYLMNVKIQNTILDWNNINDLISSIQVFPAKLNVLNYYSLVDNDTYHVYNNNKYLNTDYLYKSSNYALYYSKEDANNIVTSFTFVNNTVSSIVSAAILNNTLSSYIPDYFSFDMLDSTNGYPISNLLRNYIYNWNKNTDAFTIAFFGKLKNDLHNFSNCPIFCDYNLNNGLPDTGLYVYLNKLYRTSENIDVAAYNTNFESYYSKLANDNSWGLYVLEFVHEVKLIGNNNVSVPTSLFNTTYPLEIKDKHMLVNLTFYPYSNTDEKYILIPNNTTLAYTNNLTSTTDITSALIKAGYLIPTLPADYFDNISYPIRLFANKRFEADIPSLKNWDYFSGTVKNLLLFNTILNRSEINAILSAGFNTSYNWLSKSLLSIIKNISTSSYIGALAVYNSNNVNLIGNNIIG